MLQISLARATGSHGAQHTAVVQLHAGSLAGRGVPGMAVELPVVTLHTAGMSVIRGSPAGSMPMRHAYLTSGMDGLPPGDMPG